jgi:hypothetical protein
MSQNEHVDNQVNYRISKLQVENNNGFFSGFSTAVAIALLLGLLDHVKCRDEC